MSGSATSSRDLRELLHPSRIKCSGRFTAMLAYILGTEPWATPAITDMVITSDGMLLVGNEYDPFDNEFVGSETDLWKNLRGVAKAAELTKAETTRLLRLAHGRVRHA